jgi:hypothetical protein
MRRRGIDKTPAFDKERETRNLYRENKNQVQEAVLDYTGHVYREDKVSRTIQ